MKRILLMVVLFILLCAFAAWLLFGFFGVQALFTDRIVNEAVPDVPALTDAALTDAPLLLASGNFVQGDSTYAIAGSASVTREGDTRTLSLRDFSVSNGPDLFLYLVYPDTTDNASVKAAVDAGNFVNIGELKGNIGNQVYPLPSDVQLENAVVSIWCKRFSRNFGMAPLVSPAQAE